jgi:uncharacterized Ntn-hydrolase superfamily protein
MMERKQNAEKQERFIKISVQALKDAIAEAKESMASIEDLVLSRQAKEDAKIDAEISEHKKTIAKHGIDSLRSILAKESIYGLHGLRNQKGKKQYSWQYLECKSELDKLEKKASLLCGEYEMPEKEVDFIVKWIDGSMVDFHKRWLGERG